MNKVVVNEFYLKLCMLDEVYSKNIKFADLSAIEQLGVIQHFNYCTETTIKKEYLSPNKIFLSKIYFVG
jgi:hypothetical protein